MRSTFFAAAAFTALAFSPTHAEVLLHSGDVVAFMGDSITGYGWSHPDGYVHLVQSGLAANGINITVLPLGIGGDQAYQMLARLKTEVLENAQHPVWMTLSCGVNDVAHGKKGTPLDAAMKGDGKGYDGPDRGTYVDNVTKIVEQTQAAGIKVMLLTATMIQENPESPENRAAIPYNEFLRQLAKEKNLPLADLSADFLGRLKTEYQQNEYLFTVDGVHMKKEGDKLMAQGVLKAFGLDADQMQKAEAAWAVPPPPPAAPPAAVDADQ